MHTKETIHKICSYFMCRSADDTDQDKNYEPHNEDDSSDSPEEENEKKVMRTRNRVR